MKAERNRSGAISYSAIEGDRVADLDGPFSAGMPVKGCFARWIEAPLESVSKARRVLPTVLDIQLPFALEDCVYSILNVSPSDQATTRALAVGARKSDVASRLRTLAETGVDPVFLGHEGLALWNQGLAERGSEDGETRIIAYLGAKRWTLVVGHEDRFTAAHGVKSGDYEQAGRILRSYSPTGGDKDSVRWLLCGPGAAPDERPEEKMGPLFNILKGRQETVAGPELFLARALAACALTSGECSANLRAGGLEHPKLTEHKRKVSMRAALVSLAAGLVLCVFNVGARVSLSSVKSSVDADFEGLADRLAGYHITAKGRDAVTIVERIVKERTARLAPFAAAFQPSLTSHIKALTSMGAGTGLVFEWVSIDSSEIMIRGTAPGWNSCDNLVSYLRSNGYACELDRGEADKDGAIPFVIRPLKP